MDDHIEGVRSNTTQPFSKIEAFISAQRFVNDIDIQRTAAALQVCLNEYTNATCELLCQHYGFNEKSHVYAILSTGKYSEAVWAEFAPFLSLASENNKNDNESFAHTFKLAHANQAFQSHRRGLVKTCPAQFLIKHFMNMNVVDGQDNQPVVLKNPAEGALPAYIYRKIKQDVPAPMNWMQRLG